MNDTPRYTFGQRLLAIAQLMRLANVFTAIADVWMGFLLVMSAPYSILLSLGLTLSSCLLYTAGMVLNDVMDAKLDAVERPERPIPSGKVSLRFGNFLGWNLLFSGIFVSFVMSFICSSAAPAIIAWVLSVLIVAYNSWLKKTWLGPFALGACRAGNILLGMSPLIIQLGIFDFIWAVPLAPSLGIGSYVCGLSFFAKEEHAPENRNLLLLGTLFIACGFAILTTAPCWEYASSWLQVPLWQWFTLWSILTALVLQRFIKAIRQPTPKYVQQAVGYAILLLIPIDAVLCWGYAGWEWGAVVLALLIPAKLLARWLRVT